MNKVFEYILAKPAEFFSLLAICIALAYTVILLLKSFFGLFTRKRRAKKEKEKQEKQAELVIEKLGGVEAFSELMADTVITQIKPNMDEIKQDINAIQAMDKCPIELKAYIETVLKTSPNLLLQYEESKSKLVIKQPRVTATKLEAPVKQELPVVTESNIQKREKEDITYV